MSDQHPLFGQILIALEVIDRAQLQEALARQASTGQRLGDALVSLGYVTRERLETLKDAVVGSLGGGLAEAPPPAEANRPKLGEILVELKHITRAQLDDALARQKKDGRRIGDILIEQGYCSFKQLYEGLERQKGGKGNSEAPQPPLGKLRVLVVDDSPLACSFVEDGLLQKGYEVFTFQNPYEALEQVNRLKPAIVLSDLDMPEMDGSELCRRLKAHATPAVPVIILTANDGEAEKVGGLRAGADDYVNKSASMDELSARIESVVRRTGETERMRKLFARYTSDAVVDEILKSGEIVLTGEKREVTVLFSDLRNFTALAETLSPEEVVGILNDVLGRMSDAVLTCGGTLDKFLGDGLMAVFGAPVGRDDDAVRAVQAARMMQEAVKALNAEQQRAFREGKRAQAPVELRLGIGINTGAVVAGNLGSQQRTEYTCIGDAVNVAARLCALAGGGEILAGQRTWELAGTGDRFEEMPPVRLKGKAQPVPLYRVPWGSEHPMMPA